jgi:AmmeMemoRadiSam system protein B
MKTHKEPNVAGTFYPDKPVELERLILSFLNNTVADFSDVEDILGVIAPHAGYVYSGQCAAYSYAALNEKEFDLAVLIAPSHKFADFYYSVGDYGFYDTPLGSLQVDRELVKSLLEDDKFVFYPYAHSMEHSIEVQIPFLQIIRPEVSILPILVGRQFESGSEYLSEKLISVIGDRLKKTVFIVSSDLSHYHNSVVAKGMDTELAEAVEKLDITRFNKLITSRKSEACGYGPILTLMNLAKNLGYPKVKRLNYTHSGEVSQDNSQVVGYLSSLFYQ